MWVSKWLNNFHFGVNYHHFNIQNNHMLHVHTVPANIFKKKKTKKSLSISWLFKHIVFFSYSISVCQVQTERTGLISLVQKTLLKGQTRMECSVLSELTLQAHFRHTNIHNGVMQQLLTVQRVAQWAMKIIKGSKPLITTVHQLSICWPLIW